MDDVEIFRRKFRLISFIETPLQHFRVWNRSVDGRGWIRIDAENFEFRKEVPEGLAWSNLFLFENLEYEEKRDAPRARKTGVPAVPRTPMHQNTSLKSDDDEAMDTTAPVSRDSLKATPSKRATPSARSASPYRKRSCQSQDSDVVCFHGVIRSIGYGECPTDTCNIPDDSVINGFKNYWEQKASHPGRNRN